MKKTSPLCILLFTKPSNKGLQIWWYSAGKWQWISSRCFFPSISNWFNSLVSVAKSLPPSVFVSVCSYSVASMNREHVFVDVDEKQMAEED